MVESLKQKVVITGITGYLGSQVCLAFLNDNTFKVRGTVRDKTNPAKMQPIINAFGDKFQDLELFEADLNNAQSLDNAIEGCQYVVHVASPFPNTVPKNENDIILPAVNGTMAVMEAARKHKVKRVVITSSVATLMLQKPEDRLKLYTEAIWSNVDACGPYEKSKVLAEQKAWEFIEKLPENEKFELVTILPSLILGPNLIKGEFTSKELIQKIMAGAFPGMPRINMPIVDVRDVAMAHLKALTVKEAANQRFTLSNESLWFTQVAQILKDEFSKNYTIKAGPLKLCTLKFAAIFDKQAKLIIPYWNVELNICNQKSKNILGIQYRDSKTTIIEMAYKLIETGYVKDKIKGQKK